MPADRDTKHTIVISSVRKMLIKFILLSFRNLIALSGKHLFKSVKIHNLMSKIAIKRRISKLLTKALELIPIEPNHARFDEI